MAEFNSDMYLQQRGPDILGGIQGGLRIGEMKRQRQAANEARMFKQGLQQAATTDANGNVTYDQKRLGELGGMFPQEVAAMQAQSKEAAMEQKKREQEMLVKHQEFAAPIVLGMSDPQSYQLGLQKLKAAGNPMAAELPPTFDPKYMAGVHRQVTPVAQHFAMQKEKNEMEAKGFQKDPSGRWVQVQGGSAQIDDAYKVAQTRRLNNSPGIGMGVAGGRGDPFKHLPKEGQITVSKMADKNASKNAIANSLQAGLEAMQAEQNEDVKIKLGESLLKTLNSPEGVDAIGAEEAKRLGGLLQFKKFNMFEPGSMFGRDVPEFEGQLGATVDYLREGVKKNQKEIDSAYESAGVNAPQRGPQAKRDGDGGKTKEWDGVVYKVVGGEWVPQGKAPVAKK